MTPHYEAALKILRYLKSAPGQGLFFPTKNNLKLSAFSNSDWPGCADSRKSITGYCTFLGDALISWKCKKQSIMAKYSFEVEYRDLAATTCEVQWRHFLLKDLSLPPFTATLIYCDNQSALHIATNLVFHNRLNTSKLTTTL